MKKRHKLVLAIASLALGCGAIQSKPAQAAVVGGQIDIYAAASLNGSLQAVEDLYKRNNPSFAFTFNNTFGASGTLVNQILTNTDNRNIDIFFPVSEAPLDTLQSNGKLVAGTRQDVLGNTLAVIEPTNGTVPISSPQDILNLTRNVAIGDPAVVPAGQFATQFFTNSGILQQLQDNKKLVFGTDVRDVLDKVSSATNDTIDAGVVYTTDALTRPDLVKVVYTPPTNLYSPIVYGSAVLAQTQNLDAAKDFNSFLASPQAFSVFQSSGFSKPVPEPLTIGGSIAAGLFGVAMKRKMAAKAKAKAAVD